MKELSIDLTYSDVLSRAYQHGDCAIIGDTHYIAGSPTNQYRYDDMSTVSPDLYDILALLALHHSTKLMWGKAKCRV